MFLAPKRINDGTVSGASAGIAWTLPYGVEYPKIAGGLIMSGENGVSIRNDLKGLRVEITGGHFSDDVGNDSSKFELPEGKKLVKRAGKSYYELGVAVAQIDNSLYATLGDAHDAVTDTIQKRWTPAYARVHSFLMVGGGFFLPAAFFERCWEASARSWAVCGSARRSAVP